MYQLFTVVVRNQAEAIEVCRDFVEKKSIDSVLLCPGFTHSDVAEIVKAVGKNVAVSVARGDGPSGKISLAARKREGYMPKIQVDNKEANRHDQKRHDHQDRR